MADCEVHSGQSWEGGDQRSESGGGNHQEQNDCHGGNGVEEWMGRN